MDKLDNYDKLVTNLESARSLNIALTLLNQTDCGILNRDLEILNSLAVNLIEEANTCLKQIRP